ncbi:hypothetical protein F53441_14344 [Fusarium austroafricanum]|uniref:2EXR domain-containing protein n=1 Tax=Fusarium austroafricanum TaxID=2364996 RepID=A0A8H4NB58_9HYPO|nr:hypothetical protein F53441_14344 [Fusarium austroafricanum]
MCRKLFCKRTSYLKTLPQFSRLPEEIQRLIWAYALCVDAPRAYFVSVHCGQDFNLSIKHFLTADLGRYPDPPASNPCADFSLARVCHMSRGEVAHEWNAFQPEAPVSMSFTSGDGVPSRVGPYNLRGEKDGPGIVIDGAHDLIIADRLFMCDHYWVKIREALSFQLRHEVSQSLNPAERDYHGLEAITKVAILALFPGMRTLYLYIQPALLVPVSKRQLAMPRDRLAAEQDDGEEVPVTFKARGRIFYELCPRKMRAAKGLPTSLVQPGDMSKYEDETVHIKFLTWQWIV